MASSSLYYIYMSNHRKLETYKLFPMIAWGIFIGFALFIYSITLELRDVSDSLERTAQTNSTLESKINEQEARLRVLETEDTTE